MLVGHPGTGKTGSLACLLNAGYHIRLCAFENNEALLAKFAPKGLKNLEIFKFEDNITGGTLRVEAKDPTAFSSFLKFLDTGEYFGPDGVTEKLDPLRKWPRETILAVDSVSSMADAAFRRVLKVANRNAGNRRRQDWGSVAAELNELFQKLNGSRTPCHVIVMAHVKLISPDVETEDDTDLQKKVKIAKAEFFEPRWYVKAPGRALPMEDTARHFGALLETAVIYDKAGKPIRVIHTDPRPDIDIKLPLPNIKGDLPIETGLLTIMQAQEQVNGEED